MNARCAHCALPVARSATTSATTTDDEAFCCAGCFVAWHLSGAELGKGSDRLLARLVLSAFLSMGVMVFSLALYGRFLDDGSEVTEAALAMQGILRLGAFALTTPIVALLAIPQLHAAIRMLRFLTAEALIAVGVLSAWTVSVWNTFASTGGEVYYETVAMVLVLTTLGRWLDVRARDRAQRSLAPLADDEHASARRVSPGGVHEVEVAVLRPGDVVRCEVQDVLAVDGLVVAGAALVDGSSLTGEEHPREVGVGERVLAGCRVVEGTLDAEATAVRGGRVRDEVDRLLQSALERRSPTVRVADRMAAVLLPTVLLVAAATAAWAFPRYGAEEALLRALSVLLISCPCALGIATPLVLWSALARARAAGVVVRGSDVLERLARARRVFLDKTGTLTTGELELVSIDSERPADEILALAASLEVGAEHPIAREILRENRGRADVPLAEVAHRRIVPGMGVEGQVDGRSVRLGRASEGDGALTRVALEVDGERVATLAFRARPRRDAARAVERLRALGLEPVILTGDAAGPASAVASELGVEARPGLLPGDKVAELERAGRGTIFVGDGINDAAALATAEVGVAVAGAAGASIEAADVSLLRVELEPIADAIELARRAVGTARRNLVWAFAYNGFGLWLAATGRLTPIFAASAMVVSSAVVVLGSSLGPRRETRPSEPGAAATGTPAVAGLDER